MRASSSMPSSEMPHAGAAAGRLAGCVAVVIGAAQGIGAGIARRFAGEGAQLVLGDRDVDGAERLAAELPAGQALARRTDVAVAEDVEALAAAAVERFGTIDTLIQNAGIYPLALIEDADAQFW